MVFAKRLTGGGSKRELEWNFREFKEGIVL